MEESPEVYIANIPFTSTEEDLRRCCSSFGDVVKIHLQKKDGRFKGAGNVLFRTLESARSMASQKVMLDGRKLTVKLQSTRTAKLYSQHTAITIKNGRITLGHVGSKENIFIPVYTIVRPMEAAFKLKQRKISWELQYTLKIEIDFEDIADEISTAFSAEGPYITILLRRPARMYDYDTQLSQKSGDPWRRFGEQKLSNHFGSCLVHRLQLSHNDQTQINEVMRRLEDFGLSKQNSFPMNSIAYSQAHVQYVKHELTKLPFETLFRLDSLVTNGIVPPYNEADPEGALDWKLFVEALVGSDQAQAAGALELMVERKKRIYKIKDEFVRCLDKVDTAKRIVAKDMAMVHRMIITPTKYYLIGPDIEVSNRVIRHYSQYLDRFLRVSFLDENFTNISSNEIMTQSIIARFETLLVSGFTIADRKYEFLAFSSSQLRMHSCWFFAPTPELDCDTIRNWMGDFSGIKTVAKCAARMGQCFSTSFSTGNVSIHEFTMIDDIYTRPVSSGERYCFTDGVGKMSFDFATEACNALDERPASAFQIRFKGFKGVVAKWPDTENKLELRPSMRKFESNHEAFEVISIARYVPAYLNRQVIQLLGHAGVPDEPFIELQNQTISDVRQMIDIPAIAKKVLTERTIEHGTGAMVIESLESFHITEPFLQNVLRASAAKYLKDVKNKSRIYVKKGCNLVGVIDESGLLENGQVFIQFTKPKSKKTKIIQGPVVVSKPPCLHPGDIRRLEAVDHPALRHLVDCIVFPAKGKRPHTQECSGSDLDGDRYLVIYDRRLIPASHYPPGDYEAPKPEVVDRVTTRDIIKFFVNYIQNDALGMIAHSHMATADRESPAHKDCLHLAHLHSVAVDFPKSGVPAQMLPQLRPSEYPDFMEKREKPKYESVKVIGILYRQVVQPELKLKTAWADVEVDPDLIYPGFEEYIEEALTIKRQYNFNLRSTMNQFGIKFEAEALSGHIFKFNKPIRNREYETTQEVRKAIHSLRYTWRDEFFREFLNPAFRGAAVREEQKKKASAWYLATYDQKYAQNNTKKEQKEKKEEKEKEKEKEKEIIDKETQIGTEKVTETDKQKAKTKKENEEPPEDFLLSFPWVVHDILCEIKNASALR
eukprot:Phypoly_transcript_00326.p1 GENE.Phypoly_transcript_00326~~Phypoly_transcript_00326.p1  ORF type:complete len:1110 (+),score=131.29 Phypoly_transcript_00326:1837-5166(+)